MLRLSETSGEQSPAYCFIMCHNLKHVKFRPIIIQTPGISGVIFPSIVHKIAK